MPKQRESNIEDFAYDYLHAYYGTRHNTKNILIGKAERTKQSAATANILALRTSGDIAFVAALNTQLSPKIARLLTRYKKQGLSKFRLITALVLFAAALFFGKTMGYHWALLYLLPVVVAITGFILHSLLEKKYLERRLERLVDELKKTPADEQWLGISISSLALRHNALASHFISICKRRGIGVITVGKRAKVVQLQESRTICCLRGDFLSYYMAEDQIRWTLRDNTILRVA